MKFRKNLLSQAIIVALFTVPAMELVAQTPGSANFAIAQAGATGMVAVTGEISGVVTDAVRGVYLVGAEVRISGIEVVAVTDSEGRFTLRSVPVGNYTLDVSYLGRPSRQASMIVHFATIRQPAFSREFGWRANAQGLRNRRAVGRRFCTVFELESAGRLGLPSRASVSTSPWPDVMPPGGAGTKQRPSRTGPDEFRDSGEFRLPPIRDAQRSAAIHSTTIRACRASFRSVAGGGCRRSR